MPLWSKSQKPKYLTTSQLTNVNATTAGWVYNHPNGFQELLVAMSGVTPTIDTVTPTSVFLKEGGALGRIIATLSTSGGVGPYTYTLVDGLTNRYDVVSDKLVSGTAVASAGTHAPIIRVTDAIGATKDVTLSIVRTADTARRFSCLGMRAPNKIGTAAAGRIKWGVRTYFKTPPYWTKAWKFAFTDYYVLESGSTNETAIPNNFTIEAVAMKVGSTVYNAATAIGGGITVIPANATGGVVVALDDTTSWIAPNTDFFVDYAFAIPDGGQYVGFYEPKNTSSPIPKGEFMRYDTATSFAAAVNAGTFVSGSPSGAFNSVYSGPAWASAIGGDGRPVFLGIGPSGQHGTPGVTRTFDTQGVMGNVEPALQQMGMMWACTAVRGSKAQNIITTPTDFNRRGALIDQDENVDGTPLFDWIIADNPSGNDIGAISPNTLAGWRAAASTFFGIITGRRSGGWNKPILLFDMIARTTTTDSYGTLGNQTYYDSNSTYPTGIRHLVNADLAATKLNSLATKVALTNGAFSDGTDPGKVTVSNNTYILANNVLAAANTLYLSSAPEVGMALAVGSSTSARIRLVSKVTTIGANNYQVDTLNLDSSGIYPAANTGDVVRETYSADGNPSTTGSLHTSHYTNVNRIAPVVNVELSSIWAANSYYAS